MGFVLQWEKKLGYRSDPFVAQPSKRASDFFVGREEEREKLNLFVIKGHKFGFIHGPEGIGKSTLLGWLEEELKAQFLRIKVLSFREKMILSRKKPFFEAFLETSMNLLERNMTKPHEKLKEEELEEWVLARLAKKQIVILIDDIHELADANKEFLQRLLTHCPHVRVIMVTPRILKEHEIYGKDVLNIELGTLPAQAMRDMIKKRIALVGGIDTFPFSKEELQKLVERAKGQPVRMLSLAHDRAIELSLKVEGPPKPEKKAAEPEKKTAGKEVAQKAPEKERREKEKAAKKAESDEEAPKSSSKGWFSIKIVKEEDEQGRGKAGREMDESIIDESIAKPSEQAMMDANMLSDIVNTATEKKVEKEEQVKEEDLIHVEDVIQSLVEEMDEKKKQ